MTKVTTVKLLNDKDVSAVCGIVNAYPFEIDATVGRYLLDAKSIMGLLSLGFGKDIVIFAHTEDTKAVEALKFELTKWEPHDRVERVV